MAATRGVTVRDYIVRRARIGALAAMSSTLVGALVIRYVLPADERYDRRIVWIVAALALFATVRLAIAWTTRCPACRHSLVLPALAGSVRHLDRCPKCGMDFDEPIKALN